jgi:hypothetical protein
MLRKMVITLAAAAALTAGSMIPALAHGMGGGGHGGGGGMGNRDFGHGGGFAHSSGFVGGRAYGFQGGFHDGRFAFRDHHRFFFNSFAFYGGYPYDAGCYRRIWTRWGWRVVSVCY